MEKEKRKRTVISSGTLCSVIEYGLPLPFLLETGDHDQLLKDLESCIHCFIVLKVQEIGGRTCIYEWTFFGNNRNIIVCLKLFYFYIEVLNLLSFLL